MNSPSIRTASTTTATGTSFSSYDDDNDDDDIDSGSTVATSPLELDSEGGREEQADVEKQSLLSSSFTPTQDDDDDDDDDDDGKVVSTLSRTTRYYLNVLFLLVNIAAWYTTNANNGIAMQRFSQRILSHGDEDDVSNTSANDHEESNDQHHDFNNNNIISHDADGDDDERHSGWIIVTTATLIVTTLQLLLGALLGTIILQVALLVDTRKQGLTVRHLFRESVRKPTFAAEAVLSVLHAMGSSFTNLGFLWGKASLVQIIKLLEPFETLVWSHLLLPRTTAESSQALRAGVVSGMSVVVGAALSLLHMNHHAPTQLQAVLFATLSGLTLSLRNVLTRKVHHAHRKLKTTKSFQSTSSTTSTVSTGHDTLTQFEKSIWQFTQLSFLSGKSLAIGTALLCLVLRLTMGVTFHDLIWTNLRQDPAILLWHASYNIFSYVVLGSTSALTHSLLNAGKRVYSILLAILVFHEPLQLDTWLGLIMVGVGGIWYTMENTKSPVEKGGDGSNDNFFKPSLALCMLVVLYSIRFWERSHESVDP